MKYDLIVVEGGTIGLSAAFNSAQRGLKTSLIELHQIHSDKNSSRGFDRCFRILYSVKYPKIKGFYYSLHIPHSNFLYQLTKFTAHLYLISTFAKSYQVQV